MWLHEWRLHHCCLGERTACLIHFLAPFSRLIFFCLSLDGHHNFVWAKYMRRRHNNKQKTIQYWLKRHYIWAQKKRTKFLSNLTAKQGPMTNQKKKRRKCEWGACWVEFKAMWLQNCLLHRLALFPANHRRLQSNALFSLFVCVFFSTFWLWILRLQNLQ